MIPHPPWIVVSDGDTYAIVPAGRDGVVLGGLSSRGLADAIVAAANRWRFQQAADGLDAMKHDLRTLALALGVPPPDFDNPPTRVSGSASTNNSAEPSPIWTATDPWSTT